MEVFTSSCILHAFNSTNICLIPKTLGVESISQYRSISLCNTLYKLITKKRGRSCIMVINIDLEKAYDIL
ncbi:hypothetical protein CFOL_v3_07958 [Cephalotus follicularis]|uniref:Reverse transcriptase domain-containing protein n=1 Tax=Cephalotus follicularis TaxID=3775 RepID=A0A1Q3B8Z2_CEPFO|nr:hypothetical protein CFOL_v3_07958 [Cephalotus follicularis]